MKGMAVVSDASLATVSGDWRWRSSCLRQGSRGRRVCAETPWFIQYLPFPIKDMTVWYRKPHFFLLTKLLAHLNDHLFLSPDMNISSMRNSPGPSFITVCHSGILWHMVRNKIPVQLEMKHRWHLALKMPSSPVPHSRPQPQSCFPSYSRSVPFTGFG